MKKASVKVLIVDDDEDDYILTSDYLKEIPNQNFSIDWCYNYNSALNEIARTQHDVYIVDYLLDGHTGIDLLKESAKNGLEAPFIILTGKGDHATDMKAMELGAADYLVKGDMDALKIERSIRYAIERTDALKAIRTSEAKYRNIFERSRDTIYITDEDGNFIEVNHSASQMFGYTREELMNLNAKKLYFNESDRKLFEEIIQRAGEVNDFEVTLKTKSGEKRYCVLSASLQVRDDGKKFYEGIIHNITQRRKIEQDLATAEKLAVTGRVVRMLAHEVRNPLTNIYLSIEQILASPDCVTEDGEVYLDIIKRNSQRINQIITELLTSSKPAELNFSKVSVNCVLEETLNLAQDRILLKEIKVVKNLSENMCEISMDAEKMRIALLNIIVNAIEAMEPKKGVLTLKTHAENNKCVVTIEDNGSGIPKEILSKIFDPFFSGKIKGTGLGLSTTHNIILTHKGIIDVESEQGKGTRFRVEFNLEND